MTVSSFVGPLDFTLDRALCRRWAYRCAPRVEVRVVLHDAGDAFKAVSLGDGCAPRLHCRDGRSNPNWVDTDYDLVALQTDFGISDAGDLL